MPEMTFRITIQADREIAESHHSNPVDFLKQGKKHGDVKRPLEFPIIFKIQKSLELVKAHIQSTIPGRTRPQSFVVIADDFLALQSLHDCGVMFSGASIVSHIPGSFASFQVI
jgi:hypothetical protein